jgi:hypothetical protein
MPESAVAPAAHNEASERGAGGTLIYSDHT